MNFDKESTSDKKNWRVCVAGGGGGGGVEGGSRRLPAAQVSRCSLYINI